MKPNTTSAVRGSIGSFENAETPDITSIVPADLQPQSDDLSRELSAALMRLFDEGSGDQWKGCYT